MTDTRFLLYLVLAIVVGLMIEEVGEVLEETREPEPPAFTEQDIFCAEYIRQSAQFADMYTDRELLRICRTHRIVNESTEIP